MHEVHDAVDELGFDTTVIGTLRYDDKRKTRGKVNGDCIDTATEGPESGQTCR